MGSQAAYPKKVKIGANALPTSQAGLSMGGEVLDDTEMLNNAGTRSRLVGLLDWQVSGSGPYDAANTAVAALYTAWSTRAPVTVQYLPNGTAGYQGSGVVENFEISGDVGALETFQFTISADGALSAV